MIALQPVFAFLLANDVHTLSATLFLQWPPTLMWPPPHAQHAVATFGSSVPHAGFHPVPAVPLLAHHFFVSYAAQSP